MGLLLSKPEGLVRTRAQSERIPVVRHNRSPQWRVKDLADWVGLQEDPDDRGVRRSRTPNALGTSARLISTAARKSRLTGLG